MYRILWIGSAIAGIILLAACAQPAAAPANTPAVATPPANTQAPEQPVPSTGQIAGSAWTLVEYNGQPPQAGTTVTLLFGEDSEASGSDGCNLYTTEYTVDGSNLTFHQPVLVTRKACGEAINRQSGVYQSALAQTETYAIEGEQLTLFLSGSQGFLVFTAQ